MLTRKELTKIIDEMSDAGRCLAQVSRQALPALFEAIEDGEANLIGWDDFWGAITGSSGVKDGEGKALLRLSGNLFFSPTL